ncbi:MAG TPA: alanine--tRNA ligase [Candidatus Paceibacterota bacterium]|nr:alanine--tRNA ligase [Candidatus Paceibacterota bacterium]
MTSSDVRSRFLAFYQKRGHAVIPSASLVPENDPTTLFTGSGMQPLVPYLLGEKHPAGKRLVNSQKSFRAEDIDEVGDNRHTTFFEMLGNWSLGDYFKKEQLPWFFEFLTDEVGLDPKRLYVTVYAGDEKNGVPRDDESVGIWKDLFKKKGIDAKDVMMGTEEKGAEVGMQGGRIFYYSKKNWWSRAGAPEKMPANEPGGPDSEVFYEFESIEHDPKFGKHCHPNCDCGRYLEIGNSVFMEYRKTEQGAFEKLTQRNVDFGGGLERITAASIGSPDVFMIDIFKGAIGELEKLSGKSYSDEAYRKSFRIIADHMRACIHLMGDGVMPSNTEQGYFVRRFLRRAVRHLDLLGIKEGGISTIVDSIIGFYKDAYPSMYANRDMIASEIQKEADKFRKTIADGMHEFHKLVLANGNTFNGDIAFVLFTSYGFPFEVALEVAEHEKVSVAKDTKAEFESLMKKHQDLSRAGSEQKFKGGLGDTSEMSVKYHTATHLLHKALHEVLGEHVSQKGSNITPERLRFDFTHGAKMTDEEKKRVEAIVNEKIKADLPVHRIELPKEEAEKTGAFHFFGDKYGDKVSVYYIGDSLDTAYSKEFCGGPQVERTGVLGTFKIQKEEAVSAGVRRIKAVLSN